MSKNKNLTDKIINGSVLNEFESNLLAENIINRKINDYEIVSLLTFLFQTDCTSLLDISTYRLQRIEPKERFLLIS